MYVELLTLEGRHDEPAARFAQGTGALGKLPAEDARLAIATIYSSLEPCARRASRPHPCAQPIRATGLRRVIPAWCEPDTFVAGAEGTKLLEDSGAPVVELPEYANAAQAPNQHLL